MFADPYLLEKDERAELAGQLRECVVANPEVSELRVLFGMALCVNFEVPGRHRGTHGKACGSTPDSFIAQLKMGELWMRLRVMDKAEEHTQQAALLAQNHGAVGTGSQAGGHDSDHDSARESKRGRLQGTLGDRRSHRAPALGGTASEAWPQ